MSLNRKKYFYIITILILILKSIEKTSYICGSGTKKLIGGKCQLSENSNSTSDDINIYVSSCQINEKCVTTNAFNDVEHTLNFQINYGYCLKQYSLQLPGEKCSTNSECYGKKCTGAHTCLSLNAGQICFNSEESDKEERKISHYRCGKGLACTDYSGIENNKVIYRCKQLSNIYEDCNYTRNEHEECRPGTMCNNGKCMQMYYYDYEVEWNTSIEHPQLCRSNNSFNKKCYDVQYDDCVLNNTDGLYYSNKKYVDDKGDVQGNENIKCDINLKGEPTHPNLDTKGDEWKKFIIEYLKFTEDVEYENEYNYFGRINFWGNNELKMQYFDLSQRHIYSVSDECLKNWYINDNFFYGGHFIIKYTSSFLLFSLLILL